MESTAKGLRSLSSLKENGNRCKTEQRPASDWLTFCSSKKF